MVREASKRKHGGSPSRSIENRLSDLHSIMSILNPGPLPLTHLARGCVLLG